MVSYLAGEGQQRPERTNALAALENEASIGSYYADSALREGQWHGRGAERLIPVESRGRVEPLMLERVLLGQDPVTGERRIGTQGANARAHAERQPSQVDPTLTRLSASEAAALAGVDASYIRRIAARTAAAEELPGTYLVGVKERSGWVFERSEVERFAAQRSGQATVLGFDLTFSVPKSVSVAWAVADEAGREVIEDALHQAVDEALSYLQDTAAVTGRDGNAALADDFIAASFLHDTNRELEPQLHMHVAVANMGTRPDGAVRSLDGRPIYGYASTAGHLAEAEIQRILTEHGYRFTPTVDGIAHVVGVPQKTVEAMSTRRAQILAEVDAFGVDSRAARQHAAYATRAPKGAGVDRDEAEARWQERFIASGFDHRQQAALTSHRAPLLWTPDDDGWLFRHLSSPQGVTHHTAIFDRRGVLETIVDASGGRLSAADVQTLADRWLHSDAAIPLERGTELAGEMIGRHRTTTLTPGSDWFTTPEMVRVEQSILDGYDLGLTKMAAELTLEDVTTAVTNWETRTGHRLGEDQRTAITELCTSGHRFQAFVGPAGSGKTAALEIAARAWEANGFTVIGAAVNGNAAEVLERSTGIPSRTVASLVAGLQSDALTLDPSTVLIVDEASTLGNRDHATLVRHVANAGAAMRTVGDPAQHTAVAAGGMWAHLVKVRSQHVPTLTDNRRMTGVDMAPVRLAVDDYRNGRIADALNRLHGDNRMVTAATSSELLDQLAADWFVDWTRHVADPDTVNPSRMLAENHSARRELNERAQLLLRTEGLIDGPGVRIGEASFHVGDRVQARAQNRELRASDGSGRWVRNGTPGTVTRIHGETGDRPSLTVDFDQRGEIHVPHDWLTAEIRRGVAGGLTPAYAMTTHAAQGDTLDASRSLVTDRSSTAGQYVALTRGQNDVRLYSVDSNQLRPDPPLAEHNIPTVDDERPLWERIETRLTRPETPEVAIATDPGLAAIHSGHATPVSAEARKERLADTRLSYEAITAPPPHLVAMLGPRPHATNSEPWDTAVVAHARHTTRWQLPDSELPIAPAAGSPPARIEEHEALVEQLTRARAARFEPLEPALRSTLTDRYTTATPVTGVEATRHEHLANAVATANTAQLAAEQNHKIASTTKVRRHDPDAPERARRSLAVSTETLTSSRAALHDHQLLTDRSGTNTQANLRQSIERNAIRLVPPPVPTQTRTPAIASQIPGPTRTLR